MATVDQIVYTDVDGDGHEDALAALRLTSGEEVHEVFYIWLWDESTQSANQVEQPIAHAATCGDTVHNISAAEGAFVITETLRFQDGPQPGCDEDGEIEVTRHVAVEDGWPTLSNGTFGYGGLCPQWCGTDDVFAVGDLIPRAVPVSEARAPENPERLSFVEVALQDHPWLFEQGWLLIQLAFAVELENPDSDHPPCAWVALDDDDRAAPEPGF